ncbi:MAG: hypothetical protein Fur0018_25450 [Anaerolineales bacterium]
MTNWMVAGTIALAIFTQSFSGFGFALVSMPLLTPLLGLKISAPLVALLGGTSEVVLITYFRESLTFREIGRLIVASLAGTIVGVGALRFVPERVLLPILGLVLVGYVLYNWLHFRLPEMRSPRWAYTLGLLSGALGGAYNTSGPPVIIYGHASKWTPEQFKGNLQGFFFVNNLFVLTGHYFNGALTPQVWHAYLITLPALMIGIAGGLFLGHKVDSNRFRQVVLALLLVLGLKLIF